MSKAVISIKHDGKSLHISSHGNWLHQHLSQPIEILTRFKSPAGINSIAWEFSEMEAIDAPGIILILQFMRRYADQDTTFTFTGMHPEHQRMFLFYRKNFTRPTTPKVAHNNIFAKIGRSVIANLEGFVDYVTFFGETIAVFLHVMLRPHQYRFSATVKQIQTSGLMALPIISLTAFLVGLVIAYQSAEQLAQFGASIFIVEMVSISVFRELAPMITAIVVAGRSASAYTAEIGTMKITEEIDAMRTMGFEPQRFLIQPRVIALMLVMPLIVFFADMIGVFGGMVIAKIQLNISFIEFINRLHAEVDIRHITIGLIKAPIFGLLIATIGCFRGLQVTGSTDSIGYFTTVSVVNAIFWVIASNALISVILTEIGI